jgi:hypothetical protein
MRAVLFAILFAATTPTVKVLKPAPGTPAKPPATHPKHKTPAPLTPQQREAILAAMHSQAMEALPSKSAPAVLSPTQYASGDATLRLNSPALVTGTEAAFEGEGHCTGECGAEILIDKPGASTLRLIDCSVDGVDSVAVAILEFSASANKYALINEKVPVQNGHLLVSYMAGANMNGASNTMILLTNPGTLFSCEITPKQ